MARFDTTDSNKHIRYVWVDELPERRPAVAFGWGVVVGLGLGLGLWAFVAMVGLGS